MCFFNHCVSLSTPILDDTVVTIVTGVVITTSRGSGGVATGLVFGLELETVRNFAEKHFRNSDPIATIFGCHERFEVGASTEMKGRSLVHGGSIKIVASFQESHGNVTVQKTKPFQKEASRGIDAHLVRSPMFQAVLTKLFQQVQSFAGGNIPVTRFLNLRG